MEFNYGGKCAKFADSSPWRTWLATASFIVLLFSFTFLLFFFLQPHTNQVSCCCTTYEHFFTEYKSLTNKAYHIINRAVLCFVYPTCGTCGQALVWGGLKAGWAKDDLRFFWSPANLNFPFSFCASTKKTREKESAR